MAQPSADTAHLAIEAYADAYFAHYDDSARKASFQDFPTVSPRSDKPSLNIVQVATRFSAKNVRANLTLQAGDIATSAWDKDLWYLQEGNAGIRLWGNTWLDAGFFKTHLGTEQTNPIDNIASSLTVGTYYEPYFESGIRVNSRISEKWEVNAYLLNGYNIFVDNNNSKSFGLAVAYTMNDAVSLIYGNYLGDDSKPGAVAQFRNSNNVAFNYTHNKLRIQAGGDVVVQQHSQIGDSSATAFLVSGLATVRYQVLRKFAVYNREEFFEDPDGIMTGALMDDAGHLTGLKLFGVTAGAEYAPVPGSYIRVEGRLLDMEHHEQLFLYHGHHLSYRYELMVNAGLKLTALKRYFAPRHKAELTNG